MASKKVDKMLKKHDRLVHSEAMKIISHTQREKEEWVLHTLMAEGCETPFKFRRTQKYKSLAGARVNITYYSETEQLAGFEIDIFKIVRIKRA
ncbi:hypothetical protein [Shewanella surugensis]|uniref:Uncharacterized protein n=1 Tax=Shewanella surugensis TaxID=212020 RepID=A0ABT0L7W2_9GAMM|nr:hypothetical protein [Shewanella surugensis]MCL1123761.1 hypothetical protein [Shewanella surugensis]